MNRTRILWFLSAGVVLSALITLAQTFNPKDLESPRQVVQSLWKLIESGSLATASGFDEASNLFWSKAASQDANAWIIYGDDYSIYRRDVSSGIEVTIEVGYSQLGKIDGQLRFEPEPHSPYSKASILYRLSRHEGKWKILGVPRHWLTRRAAITQLEAAARSTNDEALKANAAKSVRSLKALENRRRIR